MAAQAPTLRGSAPLFSFRGIRVYVHWTFLILLAYISFMGYRAGKEPMAIMAEMGLVLIVFVCVLLHEFGHALMAQRYGVETKDITLLPIGGVANLKRMPEEPKQEFWITVAGPAVNLVIALLAFIAIAIIGLDVWSSDVVLNATSGTQVLLFLFAANLTLGRILRSLLSMRMPRDKATRIAAAVGRFFSIAFVVFGLMNGQPFLALIGVFIYFAAGAETKMVEQQAALRGLRVRDVMRTLYWTMTTDSTVQQAVDALLAGGDKDLVLTNLDGSYVGVLTRRDLVEALSNSQQAQTLGSLRYSQPPAVAPSDAVNTAYTTLLTGQHALMPVMEEDRILGVLERENLTEFLMVRGALRDKHPTAPALPR